MSEDTGRRPAAPVAAKHAKRKFVIPPMVQRICFVVIVIAIITGAAYICLFEVPELQAKLFARNNCFVLGKTDSTWLACRHNAWWRSNLMMDMGEVIPATAVVALLLGIVENRLDPKKRKLTKNILNILAQCLFYLMIPAAIVAVAAVFWPRSPFF